MRTPAAAAATLHIPLIDGGGDVPVAQAPLFQGVLIAAVEGDVAPWRHLFCGQNGARKSTRMHKEGRVLPSTHNHHLRGISARGAPGQHSLLATVTWTEPCRPQMRKQAPRD